MNRRSKSIMAFLLFCLVCAVVLLVIRFLIMFIGDPDEFITPEQPIAETPDTEPSVTGVPKPWQSTRIRFFETSDIH